MTDNHLPPDASPEEPTPPVCPKCGGALIAKAGTMYYRGQYFAGLVCTPCNALWDNPADSMYAAASSPDPSFPPRTNATIDPDPREGYCSAEEIAYEDRKRVGTITNLAVSSQSAPTSSQTRSTAPLPPHGS